jgi:hypothetical protein
MAGNPIKPTKGRRGARSAAAPKPLPRGEDDTRVTVRVPLQTARNWRSVCALYGMDLNAIIAAATTDWFGAFHARRREQQSAAVTPLSVTGRQDADQAGSDPPPAETAAPELDRDQDRSAA